MNWRVPKRVAIDVQVRNEDRPVRGKGEKKRGGRERERESGTIKKKEKNVYCRRQEVKSVKKGKKDKERLEEEVKERGRGRENEAVQRRGQ